MNDVLAGWTPGSGPPPPPPPSGDQWWQSPAQAPPLVPTPVGPPTPMGPVLRPYQPAPRPRRKLSTRAKIVVAIVGVATGIVLVPRLLSLRDAGPPPTAAEVDAGFVPLSRGFGYAPVPPEKLPNLADLNAQFAARGDSLISAFGWRYLTLDAQNVGLFVIDGHDPDDLDKVKSSTFGGYQEDTLAGVEILRSSAILDQIVFFDEKGLVYIISAREREWADIVATDIIQARTG